MWKHGVCSENINAPFFSYLKLVKGIFMPLLVKRSFRSVCLHNEPFIFSFEG